jgi:diguanylate cyclase (GGDEF)-like protein
VIITVGGVLVTQFARRKTADKWLFNTGMYVVCVTAAWLVLAAAGVAGSVVVAEVSVVTVAWMAASWVVFIVVNLCVVSGLSAWSGQTWWESFAEDVPAHVTSMLAGLCLSPLIAIVAVAGQYSWIALPFLLVPLFAVQKVADSSREQEHQALHDPLTGLPNRILLADRIEQSLARGARSEGRVVLLFVDLDRFKHVNDTLGHHAGDELLRMVAERLRSIVRPGDTLARYAGDEFIVLCDHMPGAEIEGLVDRISTRMREPHSHGGQEYVCTVSIGYAVADEDSDAQSLMTAADAAMYRAKSAGRDTAVRAE